MGASSRQDLLSAGFRDNNQHKEHILLNNLVSKFQEVCQRHFVALTTLEALESKSSHTRRNVYEIKCYYQALTTIKPSTVSSSRILYPVHFGFFLSTCMMVANTTMFIVLPMVQAGMMIMQGC